MTKLILVRHGHVEGISPERFRGRAELPLTDTGRREAEATAARIAANWRPAAVYTSPLGRCVETGAAIGKAVGLTPSVVLRLNDIDYGDWQGFDAGRGICPLAGRDRPLVCASGLGRDPWRRNPAAGARARGLDGARHRPAAS